MAARLASGAVTHASLVPTMLRRLLDLPPPTPVGTWPTPNQHRWEPQPASVWGGLSSSRAVPISGRLGSSRLRAVLLGGGRFDRQIVERALDRGLPILGTCGKTETTSQVATVPPEEARR